MSRRREKRAADHARPERVIARDIPGEIKDSKLAGRIGHAHDLAPPAWNPQEQDRRREHRADKIDDQLNHVGPDHGGHPAEKRVHDRRDAHDEHRDDENCRGRIRQPEPSRDSRPEIRRRQQQRRQDESCRVQPEPVRKAACQQEEAGGHTSHRRPETLPQNLVHREQLATEIGGDEQHRDGEAPDHVTKDELKKREVTQVRKARDTDEGDGARLGGNDRPHDRPPRDAVAADEIVPDVPV